MRIALWREYFSDAHPENALKTVQYIMAARRENRTHAGVAMLALGRLIQSDPALVRKALLGAAAVAQDADVLSLLTQMEPVKIAHRTQLRAPALNTDRDTTLGERRSWARSQDRDVLTRLLLDPDPGVIQNLLTNPRLLERDVLRIASAQPVSSEVLKVVFESDKWGQRKAIQAALIQNPYTPPELGRSLLELLDEVDLKSVLNARQIHSDLREGARDKLRTRRQTHNDAVQVLEDEWVSELLARRHDESGGDEGT